MSFAQAADIPVFPRREMAKLTQLMRVKAMLDDGPVCSTDFLRAYIPRAGARIWDLRREGLNIIKRRCTQHTHGTYQIEYVLLQQAVMPL